MPFDLFISHSSKDDTIVTKIHDQLTVVGLNVWADHCDALGASDRWDMEIDKGLKDSAAGLFILSPDGVLSPHCMAECQKIIGLGKRLYIVMVRLVPKEDIPALLFNIHYENLVTDFDGGMDRLVKKITGKDRVKAAPSTPPKPKIGGGFPAWHLHIPMHGREVELDKVRAALDGTRLPHAVQITGIGGVGKSRLAAEVVNVADYAEGSIWHDCRIASLSTLAATIREHLELPPMTDEQTWIELDKHALLVMLDNGEDCKEPDAYSEVINRLHQQARVIVTSRMRWLDLRAPEQSLTQPDKLAAIQIMEDFAARIAPGRDLKGTTEQLAEAARRHPRLMEHAASWLNDMKVETVLAELKALKSEEAQEALNEMIVRSVERVRCATNGEVAIAVLRKLAVCRGGFTEEAAKAIAGEEDFGKALRLLRNWGLLRFEGERYEIDPLVIETLGEDKAAHRRHLDYYEALAHQHDEKQDYMGLDRESANLEAAFEWALGTSYVELVYRFANVCLEFQANRGRYAQRMGWWKRVQALASTYTGESIKAGVSNSVGIVYNQHPLGNRRENMQLAIAAYEQALRFWTPQTNPINYAGTQNNLGEAYRTMAGIEAPAENLRLAIAAYEQALRFWTPQTNPINYARVQNNLGVAYEFQARVENLAKNLRLAIAAYEQALLYWSIETAPLSYATTQNNLGETYRALARVENPVENLRLAIAAYEQALRYWLPETAPLDYAGTQHNLGVAYSHLAEIEARMENLQYAFAAYEEALRFWLPTTTPLNYAMTQENLGMVYEDSGDIEAAVRCWCEAEKYYRQMDMIETADLMTKYVADVGGKCG